MKTFTHALILLVFIPCISFSQAADFTIFNDSTTNCHPHRITVIQNCTGTPRAFLWDFGNGDRGLNPTEIIEYTNPGTYTIKLTAVYATTASTITKTVTINATPTVSITTDKDNLCQPGIVTFTASGSSNIATYSWDFGDNSFDTEAGRVAVHQYNDYGSYTAKLKVATTAGCTAETEYTINISKFSITATVVPGNGCIPSGTSLGVSTTIPNGDIPSSYTWNFGDGTAGVTGNDSAVTHLYNITDSIYNARVVVTTAGGCTNEIIFPPFAYGTPPTNTRVNTVSALDSFCASEKIEFSGFATNANAYKWEFGDEAEESAPDTTIMHRYRTLGNKTVTITPSFNGCEGEKDSIRIFIKGVVGNFIYGNDCSRKNDYWFKNLSIGNITKYAWQFEDGSISRDSLNFDASHVFPVQATSKASIFVYDSTTGCTDTTAFNIYTATPVFNRNTSSVCKDGFVDYNVLSTYPDSAGYMYRYYVCGDSVDNGGNASLVYNPHTHGHFSDYLVIADAIPGTCNDTLLLQGDMIVKGPVVNFSTQDQACRDKPFIFTNNSYPYISSETINTWQWNFDDSTYSNSKDAEPHIYRNPGTYNISLTATDINGCSDTLFKTIRSRRIPQVIAFPDRDTICSGRDSVILTGYTIDSLKWLPASNITCLDCDTTVVFPTQTTFYVAQATSFFGCRGYDTCEIKVFAPFNVQVFPADTGFCQGGRVNFRVQSPGGTILWDTDPTLNTSNPSNAVATPLQDASYKVTVTDSAGCYSNSAVANVRTFELPVVNAGPDRVLPYNAPFTLTPDYSAGTTSYTWDASKPLSCYTCPNPTGVATEGGSYTVMVTNANGCTAKDNINIIVACDNANLLMPTAFSPDANGLNDYFYPIARGYKIIRRFVIFNRLGNKVFEKQNFPPNSPTSGWDGIIRGAETVSSSETYVWFIEAECEQGEIVQSKGTVTLVK